MSILSNKEVVELLAPFPFADLPKRKPVEVLLAAQEEKTTKEIVNFLDQSNDLKDLEKRLQELKARIL